jgi:hypothetical protein
MAKASAYQQQSRINMATLTKNVIDNREAGYIDKLPLQQLLEQIFGQHDFRIKVCTRIPFLYASSR